VEVPVTWAERDTIRGLEGRFRLRVTFEGPQRDQIRLYALYLGAE
jgi:hypothetical protein